MQAREVLCSLQQLGSRKILWSIWNSTRHLCMGRVSLPHCLQPYKPGMYLTGQRPGLQTAAYVFPENSVIIPALSKWNIHRNSEKTVIESILWNYYLGVLHMQQASRELCATHSHMFSTMRASQWESKAHLHLCPMQHKEEPLLLGYPFHTKRHPCSI